MRRGATSRSTPSSPIPPSGEVFDYFGGGADLEARRVRFIGEPLQRIAEDHLRILRFFRFHARFGRGAPDAAALDACAARANDLMALSRERIADELLKLLALPDPAPTVALMIARGILRPVLPEIDGGGRASPLWSRPSARRGSRPSRCGGWRPCCRADPDVAGAVAARLRLSKRAARRLVSAAERDARCARSARLPDRHRRGDRPLPAGRPALARSRGARSVAAAAAGGRAAATSSRWGWRPGPVVAATLAGDRAGLGGSAAFRRTRSDGARAGATARRSGVALAASKRAPRRRSAARRNRSPGRRCSPARRGRGRAPRFRSPRRSSPCRAPWRATGWRGRSRPNRRPRASRRRSAGRS